MPLHRILKPESSEQPDQTLIPPMPAVLPILPLRGMVYYPLTVRHIVVGQPRSVRLVDEVSVGDRLIGLVAGKDATIIEPGPDDLYKIGTLGVIHRLIKTPDGNFNLIIQGLERIRIDDFASADPYLKARVTQITDILPHPSDLEAQAVLRTLVSQFNRLVAQITATPDELMLTSSGLEDARQLVYLISSSIQMDVDKAQEVLETDPVLEKMRLLLGILSREVEVVELGKKIQTETKTQIDKTQRDYILREQLKAIQNELGEGNEQQIKTEELRKKIEEAQMPEEAQNEALRELGRLERLPPASAEYGVIESYLDWLTAVPWSKTTRDNLDIEHARKVLDEDHYDLERIKERIIEFLAVRKLRQERARTNGGERGETETIDLIRREREGAILCFLGPPGVGKTSLGQSIARAMERKFTRMSLGGVHDEAEIRGHRRTYIGAMPGRLIQAVRRAGTKNPVIMLDEVDKLSSDWRGDPSSALLEVLDPEQNKDFRDNYLDVAFDLSQVLFITTANIAETIPRPLLDRMEVLELSGYTDEEKKFIARRYLLPRQIKESGLRQDEISFTDEALLRIIHGYTREAGVRNLEREIGSICRKAAALIADGKTSHVSVLEDDIVNFLRKPRFFLESKERTEVAGVATGLAVTAAGGDILFVEATRMPGNKGLIITGQLGEVMKESAQAALSYIRSRSARLGIDPNFFEKSDIHMHIPAGAIPKDGPSAGVTMAAALASLLTGRLVRADVGMTGEITLRGKVLPVGGIKEKVLAAHRAGLSTVILPDRNEKDLDDLPEEVRKEMTFVMTDTVDKVLAHALQPPVFELQKTVNE